MAKRKQRVEEEPRDLTPKEIRLRARDRERHRTLYLFAGAAIGLALLLIVAGAIYEFVYRPNSALAKVGDATIVTKDYWKRMRLERNQLQNQLVNLQQFQAQFGQQLFAQQIQQLQSTLASPSALAVQVLDQMLDEKVVAQQAATMGISVTDEEVEKALREEIAGSRGAVTESQATATTEAGVNATATATLWTPTPTPTIDASLNVTATATPLPTPEPIATRAILSDTGYTEGLKTLGDNLSNLNSVDLAQYKEVIRARLLAEKVSKAIGEEKVSTTAPQVHARHILINVITPTVEISGTNAITAPLTTNTTVTTTEAVTPTSAVTTTSAVSATNPATATAIITPTDIVTATTAVTVTTPVTVAETTTATAVLTASQQVTATALLTPSAGVTATTGITAANGLTGTESVTTTGAFTTPVAFPTPAPTPVSRTDAEAKALAENIRQQLINGGDFAALTAQYSDDSGSKVNGGDLDWFGKGRMVPPFEEAAFSLPIGQISEPIRSQFGYHLIEVLEKDENRPKDEQQLEQERREVYQTWLGEQKTAAKIERPDNVAELLPRDLQ